MQNSIVVYVFSRASRYPRGRLPSRRDARRGIRRLVARLGSLFLQILFRRIQGNGEDVTGEVMSEMLHTGHIVQEVRSHSLPARPSRIITDQGNDML